MNAEWSGLGRLTFEAQATREDTVILTGDASFELKRGTVNDVILNLALPTESSLDGGTIPQDADGGNATPTHRRRGLCGRTAR